MQLTKHTDYAFRVLIFLASMDDDRTTISAITQRFGISKTHLMKVVNELANIGWVDAVRGKNGGIRLAVDPARISLKVVLEHMEKTLTPVNCTTPMCYINGVCLLNPILHQATDAYLQYLDNYTLADLINTGIKVRLEQV